MKLWAALVSLSVATVVINTTAITAIQPYSLVQAHLMWPPKTAELYDAIRQVVHCVSLVMALPLMVVLGMPNALIGLTGISFGCATQALTGLAKRTWQAFLSELNTM